MSRFLLFGMCFFALAEPGFSQFFSLGVKAGLPLNDALQSSVSGSSFVLKTDRWLVGPTAEVHLPFRLSFEVDALYRRESFTGPSNSLSTAYTQVLNNWQIPLLVKYELHGGLLRPFVDAGATYRHLSSGVNQPSSAGFTLGGGLTLKAILLRISPELRYTRWGSGNVISAMSPTQSSNQADFLVGFSF